MRFQEDGNKLMLLPLYKKGEKSCFSNYRPISLLNITSKICEKVVFKHVFNFIHDNNLIMLLQSGFIPKYSTVNQLVYLYDTFCKALDHIKMFGLYFVINPKLSTVFGMKD